MLPEGKGQSKPLNLVYCSFMKTTMEVRVEQPLRALRMRGANVKRLDGQLGFSRNLVPDAPNILVVQRCFSDPEMWPNVMRQVISRGWLLVVERDDYPITPVPASVQKWKKSLQWKTFEACHAVQTTTPSLRDLFLKHNPEVKLLPNQLGEMPPLFNRKDDKIRVFFGALNREDAWRPLIDGFNEVFAKHPDVQPVVIHDRAFFEALETKDKSFYKFLDYSDYLKAMSSCDVALLPLYDDDFTRHKSDVKFVEAGGCRTAVIASPVVYKDTIEHEKTGLIADTPAEWEAALDKVLGDKAYRDALAGNAYDYVLNQRMLMDHIDHWMDWYHDLWKRREELTEALYERYPAGKPK